MNESTKKNQKIWSAQPNDAIEKRKKGSLGGFGDRTIREEVFLISACDYSSVPFFRRTSLPVGGNRRSARARVCAQRRRLAGDVIHSCGLGRQSTTENGR